MQVMQRIFDRVPFAQPWTIALRTHQTTNGFQAPLSQYFQQTRSPLVDQLWRDYPSAIMKRGVYEEEKTEGDSWRRVTIGLLSSQRKRNRQEEEGEVLVMGKVTQ